MRRDRVTFGMMIGIPLIQLVIFGFAINSDPKHLPTAVMSEDNSNFTRSVVTALKNSSYFEIVQRLSGEKEADDALARGRYQFVVQIPENFSRKLIRGERPEIVVLADATDPAATGNALAALQQSIEQGIARELEGALADLRSKPAPVELLIHRRYNPEGVTQHNIVPGLMGVVLTMTMAMITGLAITRERERGTMENLLSTPARPLEVMLGKIVPYILVGYIQAMLILGAAYLLFNVPIAGNLALLAVCALVFIIANLAVGITFSTLARNQLQAVQMSFFYFLPSILLSGFMFPFRGMPTWAQYVGSALPLTHFLRIVRGILLKGNGVMEVSAHLWPIVVFAIVALGVGVGRYRQTLD